MKIFVGSSSETRREAELVSEILGTLGEQVVNWSKFFSDGENAGRTVVECIEEVVNQCSAAVVVAAEDDLRTLRGISAKIPRDNVLLEYAWFVGRRGRGRAVLATLGKPELPTDLDGLLTLRLDPLPPGATAEQGEAFKRGNEKKLRQWLERARKEENYGMEASLTTRTNNLLGLGGLRAVRAVDVVGPRAWSDPQTYRYVAPQFRRYLDLNAQPQNSTMLLSKPLLEAVHRAMARARREQGDGADSGTRSVLAGAALLARNIPELEMSRILLWSAAELASPTGECVVRFHEVFHVPLFFLETDAESDRREIDYILFEADTLQGYYGRRDQNFETKTIENGSIPGLGEPGKSYDRLLEDDALLLAADALPLMNKRRRGRPG